jgi:putative peptidoglycan lipid II flippase
MQDTKTPVKVAVIALVTNVVMSIILMAPLKHAGLALANSIASGINFIILFFFLRGKLKRVDAKGILRSFAKTAFASSVMGLVGGMLLQGELWHIHGDTLNKVIYLGGTISLCIVIYFCISYLLKSEEASYVVGMVRQRLRGS